jgi:site-specific DNA-methyltransferase (cytosine-N4-specific)
LAKTSEIPFGAQFSPNQIELKLLLDIISTCAGDREAITLSIRDTFFARHTEDEYNRWKLADNVVLGARDYGLLADDGATPTALAAELLSLAQTSEHQMYARFARHILLECKGLILCETLGMMRVGGETITLNSLQRRLEDRGLHVPRGSVHLSSMRLWLAKAGIFDEGAGGGQRLYEVDEDRLREIAGISLDEIDQLTQLSYEQRAFLRALVRIPDPDPLIGSQVADLAHGLYGVHFDYKALPGKVFQPLEDLGYIRQEKSTAGRGAKSNRIHRTEIFFEQISEPILDAAAEKAGLVPRELYERPLADILRDLSAVDTHTKGIALELLTVYLARILDLEFKAWRKRSAETGGAEVDVIVEGARLIFSRWQIQAKNTHQVRLDDVAKEVGLALTFLYSNVVFMVTTGQFTSDAYTYSEHVMRTSNLNVILFDRKDFERIVKEPPRIIHILNHKARRAMQIKARVSFDSA